MSNIEMQSTIHIIETSRLQFLFLTSSVLVAAKTLEVRVEKLKTIEGKIIKLYQNFRKRNAKSS